MFWQQIEFSRILENESIGAKCPLYRDLGIRKRERLMTSPFFVRAKGLEPIRLAAPDPKSGLATNYNTPATSFLKHPTRMERANLGIYFRFCKSRPFYYPCRDCRCCVRLCCRLPLRAELQTPYITYHFLRRRCAGVLSPERK